MLFMCPSFCMRVKDGCYVCECGSLSGILQRASNELNILSGQKLSQTGSQMMSSPNLPSSITQMHHGVANARYQPLYSSGYNQIYNAQGQTHLGDGAGGSGQYQQNFFMPGMSCGHISSDCPSVCWQTDIYTGCIRCTCGNTKKPVHFNPLSNKPKQLTSPYPAAQTFTEKLMKTPSTPRLQMTPKTAPYINVPTPPTQQTLETATTKVKLSPTRGTFTSTTPRQKVTNATGLSLNNQPVINEANSLHRTPSISPKYTSTVKSSSQIPGISTIPATETFNFLKQRITVWPQKMTTSLRTSTYQFTTPTAALVNVTNTNNQRGNQTKGFEMFPLTNSGTFKGSMTNFPIERFQSTTTDESEVGGDFKPESNNSTPQFSLPGINSALNSDDKPNLSVATTERLPIAAGKNFPEENILPPGNGRYLPGLENANNDLLVMSDTGDNTVESYNGGFGLYGKVKSGSVDAATA